ncbi:uncharacterized protein [Bemisia tabaci]|uniref:uncharacterized protein n=1 Tax=Bemisia tabaci TaxID=7038 RepID=UPI003B28C457
MLGSTPPPNSAPQTGKPTSSLYEVPLGRSSSIAAYQCSLSDRGPIPPGSSPVSRLPELVAIKRREQGGKPLEDRGCARKDQSSWDPAKHNSTLGPGSGSASVSESLTRSGPTATAPPADPSMSKTAPSTRKRIPRRDRRRALRRRLQLQLQLQLQRCSRS